MKRPAVGQVRRLIRLLPLLPRLLLLLHLALPRLQYHDEVAAQSDEQIIEELRQLQPLRPSKQEA